jgi:hypothetical protein
MEDRKGRTMPKYVIEREVPGAGELSRVERQRISQESNTVVRDLGPEIQWLHSYYTTDKVYCVYVAESEDIILEHARCLDVPADRISRVAAVTDPSSGE